MKVKCRVRAKHDNITIGEVYEVLRELEHVYFVKNDKHKFASYPKKHFTKLDDIKDSIVESVINQFKQRSKVGIDKYGVTLDRNDLTPLEWIEHAKQEAMDFVLYLEKLKTVINK